MIPALLLAAALPAPAFAPPIDTPLTYQTSETRTAGGRSMRFHATRHVIFTRDGTGLVATLTIDRIDHDDDVGPGAMYRTAMGALTGRAIRFHLDASGAVTAIDDRDALWDSLCAAMRAMGKTPAELSRATAVATALAALPAAQRQAMLGSMIEPLVAGAAAGITPGSDTPIDVRARPPAGMPATLKGRQTASLNANGDLYLKVTAEGDLPTGSGASAHVAITRGTEIDPRTGLVAESHETTVTTLGSGTSTTETVMRLSSQVS